jgi:DNA primase
MGTAMTEAQLSQLRRYSANITLALDPDAAGDHATLRGLETARQTGDREWEPVVDPTGLVHQESRLKTQLRIATLPAGMDPDELARGDLERWRQVLAEARPIVDYYLDVVFGSEDLTSARGKSNAVARMAPIIREIADPVSRNHYIQLLARRIRADERVVADQVLAATKAAGPDRQASAGSARASGRPAAPGSDARRFSYGLEERIVACLLLRPDLLARLDADMIAAHTPPLSPDDFEGTENRAILGALQALPLAEDAPAWVSLSSDLPKVLQEHILALVRHAEQEPPLSDERLLKDLGDSILRLRDRGLAQQIQRLEFMISECDTTGAREQRKEYEEIVRSCAVLKWHIQSLLMARSMVGSLTSASHQGSAGPGSARSNA